MNAESNNKIRITLVKSLIGTKRTHRQTIKGLALKKLNSSAELDDTPAIRGMINKVNYLLKCE